MAFSGVQWRWQDGKAMKRGKAGQNDAAGLEPRDQRVEQRLHPPREQPARHTVLRVVHAKADDCRVEAGVRGVGQESQGRARCAARAGDQGPVQRAGGASEVAICPASACSCVAAPVPAAELSPKISNRRGSPTPADPKRGPSASGSRVARATTQAACAARIGHRCGRISRSRGSVPARPLLPPIRARTATGFR